MLGAVFKYTYRAVKAAIVVLVLAVIAYSHHAAEVATTPLRIVRDWPSFFRRRTRRRLPNPCSFEPGRIGRGCLNCWQQPTRDRRLVCSASQLAATVKRQGMQQAGS